MSLHLLDPGLSSLVVDFGRPGHRSFGVPVGGAADRFALTLGNALVGNPAEAAALEVTMLGPTVRAECDLAAVVFGAPFVLFSARQTLLAGRTFTLHAGEELRIGITPRGLRAYLCIHGGIQTPMILGSRSSLQPLAAGAVLPCRRGILRPRFMRPAFAWNREPFVLRALDGPQADWFPPDQFFDQWFRVAESSNRMGLRLEGESLAVPDAEMISEPVCPGAVQVTPDRRCIVLGVDAQTIGGYAKIAQVISADLDKLGQLRPGDQIRFAHVSLDEAATIYRAKQRELVEWQCRLRETLEVPPVVGTEPVDTTEEDPDPRYNASCPKS